MNELTRTPWLAIGIAALAAPACLGLSCNSTTPIVYLGPVGDAQVPWDSAIEAAPPPVQILVETVCPALPVPLANAVSISANSTRVYVATQSDVRAFMLDSQGCPSTVDTTFGSSGVLAVAALAIATAGEQTLVTATTSALEIRNALGEMQSNCTNQGQPVALRSLGMLSDGTGAGAFAHSPVVSLSLNLSSPGTCSGTTLNLWPAPAIAIAASPINDQTIVVAQQPCMYCDLGLAAYSPTGAQVLPQVPSAVTLCSAVSVVKTQVGVAAGDSACMQAVVYNSKLQAIGQAGIDGVPVSITAVNAGAKLLVARTHATEDGSMADLSTIDLSALQ